MAVALTPAVVGLLVGTVFLAGAVNGVAGFGFALVGTMALATVLDPATAVVLIIFPVFAVNLSLVGDLSVDDLRYCGRRFGPLIGGALVGTLAGMVLLDRLPAAPLRVGLGVVTLAFVASMQSVVPLPSWDADAAFVESGPVMAVVGALSGVLFGATNVGVQLVAYLRSRGLTHGLFVGVVALVFLGLNGLRIGAAAVLGLYPTVTVAALSVAAAVPAVAGVAVGKRLRGVVSERQQRVGVLGLLTVIGLRLLSSGLGSL
ncbi:sulfite exporter TauE/SafE family protein [Natronomonas sp.]|uniref:sulfite exporter TauE/SafE family protein n=1 Tax=Natronomonas sp. TaxID=2184060 RepID=UPI002FC2B691